MTTFTSEDRESAQKSICKECANKDHEIQILKKCLFSFQNAAIDLSKKCGISYDSVCPPSICDCHGKDEVGIPLYTHPVKELTNDEMRAVINEIVDGVTVSEMVTFLAISKAILLKAQEK